MSSYRTICEQAARAAGKILVEMQPRIQGREKGPNDLVSEADLAAQREIESQLKQAFPSYGFIGEEGATSNRVSLQEVPEFCWVVDPLDGTTNYLHGLPNYAVTMALLQAGQVQCGIVFDPILNELFWAERGAGAWLNDRRLQVSDCQHAAKALVAASFAPWVPRGSVEVARFVEALHQCQGVRRLGSAALNLAYVAAGRLDAYWATAVKLWDVAAGLLLVQEAGGAVSDVTGGAINLEKPELLAAANDSLRKEIIAIFPPG